MIQIGKLNNLSVVKILDFGIYLDGGDEFGEILLPIKQVPEDTEIEDVIEVFIYTDSEDRIIATTIKPYAMVGDFILLRTIAVETVGAFMDWGLIKDLLVPFSQQKKRMIEGRSYIVYLYLDDETKRIAASAKLDKYLDLDTAKFDTDQEVDLLIHSKTDMGYKAIINNSYWGMLYNNEIFQTLFVGQKIKGFIKKIREDQKIDLYLNKAGYNQIEDVSTNIIRILKDNDNFVTITDKSKPDDIYEMFNISKKKFKKAIGNLYKKKFIDIEKDGIRLLKF